MMQLRRRGFWTAERKVEDPDSDGGRVSTPKRYYGFQTAERVFWSYRSEVESQRGYVFAIDSGEWFKILDTVL